MTCRSDICYAQRQSCTMDDHTIPERLPEAAIRASLEQSRRDIEAGQTVLLAPVLARVRAAAQTIRDDAAETAEPDRPHA